MTYRGRIVNGQIVLNEPCTLPEGAVVEIEIVEIEEQRSTIWEDLLRLSGTAEGRPHDASREHDHYLYGTPKKL